MLLLVITHAISYENRYTTIYTMAPVFSLVLDRDITEDIAMLYPELYRELTKVGRILQTNRI